MEKFVDRKEAGEFLAEQLKKYKNNPDAIVLALPRGGVPVAYEVAQLLSLPLDVVLVRKLSVPGHKELAMGAIATGSATVFNETIVRDLYISEQDIHTICKSEQEELKRRTIAYRGQKPFPDLKNKIVILIDDGIATGATSRVAIKALKELGPDQIILAVPVAPATLYAELSKEVDLFICPLKPVNFYAVGLWYEVFSQTSDAEVKELLRKADEE